MRTRRARGVPTDVAGGDFLGKCAAGGGGKRTDIREGRKSKKRGGKLACTCTFGSKELPMSKTQLATIKIPFAHRKKQEAAATAGHTEVPRNTYPNPLTRSIKSICSSLA